MHRIRAVLWQTPRQTFIDSFSLARDEILCPRLRPCLVSCLVNLVIPDSSTLGMIERTKMSPNPRIATHCQMTVLSHTIYTF